MKRKRAEWVGPSLRVSTTHSCGFSSLVIPSGGTMNFMVSNIHVLICMCLIVLNPLTQASRQFDQPVNHTCRQADTQVNLRASRSV